MSDSSGTAAGDQSPRYQPASAEPISSGLSSCTKCTPRTVTSCWLGKARHQGVINVVWLDGHAKGLPYDRLVRDPGLVRGGTTSLWDPYKRGCQ